MKLLILIGLTFFCSSMLAQNPENRTSVKKTLTQTNLSKQKKTQVKNNAEWQGVHDALMDYIGAFYEGDTTKIIRSISPLVSKYGYMKNEKTKEYEGFAMPFADMITWVKKNSKKINAKFTGIEKVEIYEIQDKTASGKVTAWWGTDYVLLEKINEKWFLKMILWEGPLKK
jgi:Putative lumazine-binding